MRNAWMKSLNKVSHHDGSALFTCRVWNRSMRYGMGSPTTSAVRGWSQENIHAEGYRAHKQLRILRLFVLSLRRIMVTFEGNPTRSPTTCLGISTQSENRQMNLIKP